MDHVSDAAPPSAQARAPAQKRAATEDVHGLRTPIHVAEEVGARLGGSPLLLRPLQESAMTIEFSHDAIAREIMLQCLEREPEKSICPSEVARALAPAAEDWRTLMPAVRRTAKVLADEGRIAVLQRGLPVAAETTRGPIRLALRVDPNALKQAIAKIRRG